MDSTTIYRLIAIINFVVMVAVTIGLLAGLKGAAFIAIGTASFGFAALWPNYKHERGVWMAGGLVMSFTVFALFIGLMDLFAGSPAGGTPRSLWGNAVIWIGIVVVSLSLAFTIYASVVNFRLSRRLKSFVRNTHEQDGETSSATESP